MISEEKEAAGGLTAAHLVDYVIPWVENTPKKNDLTDRGAQVDLLFDRADGVINLCELKHCQDVFQVDKRYAAELKEKILIFEKQTRTKKDIF